VVYFRIVDPERIIQWKRVEDEPARQTRCLLARQHEMDDLLAQRDKLNIDIQRFLPDTEQWDQGV